MLPFYIIFITIAFFILILKAGFLFEGFRGSSHQYTAVAAIQRGLDLAKESSLLIIKHHLFIIVTTSIMIIVSTIIAYNIMVKPKWIFELDLHLRAKGFPGISINITSSIIISISKS